MGRRFPLDRAAVPEDRPPASHNHAHDLNDRTADYMAQGNRAARDSVEERHAELVQAAYRYAFRVSGVPEDVVRARYDRTNRPHDDGAARVEFHEKSRLADARTRGT